MKHFLPLLLSITFLGATAQTHLPISAWAAELSPWQVYTPVPGADANSKWQLKPFASLSAGYIFYNGGISYVSAPAGLALYHPLNTNWTAYAAATVTPTLFNVNRLSATQVNDPHALNYPFYSASGLGLSTGVQGGLIYTNDAKTFSISGSVRFERDSYPVYPSRRAASKVAAY